MQKKRILAVLAMAGLMALSSHVQAEEEILTDNLDASPIQLALEDSDYKAKVEENFYGKTKNLYNGLAEKGYTIELYHTNDSMINFGGQLSKTSSVKSMSLLDMSITLDTERMGLWKGGTGYILGETMYGKGLTESRLGDLQYVSNIEVTDERTQLSEFWYEQKLLDERIRLGAGKHDASVEFGLLEMAGDYLNSSFTLMPNIPAPTLPDQAIGTWAEIAPVDWYSFKTGIFDGGSRGDDLGFRTAFEGKSGYVTFFQNELKPSIKGHKGSYIVGSWTHSGNLETIPANEEDEVVFKKSNYGLYTAFQQMIYKEQDTEDQGLSLMGQFSWTPSNRNEIARYYGAGCAYKGLIPKRDEDVLGMGMALADLSPKYKLAEGLQNEAAIEFFYKFVLNDTITLQPDFQIVLNNGGSEKTGFALGLRSIISIAPKSPERI